MTLAEDMRPIANLLTEMSHNALQRHSDMS